MSHWAHSMYTSRFVIDHRMLPQTFNCH